MELHELKPAEGSRRVHDRVGHDTSSGNGKTTGRRQEGQEARSGGDVRLGFEGGQTPLFRRLPKRGLTSVNRRDYAVINLDILNRSEDGTGVAPVALAEAGTVKNEKARIKVLASGELNKKLIMKAVKFSKTAQGAVETADGSIEVI